MFCHSGHPGPCLIGIHTCPGKGGRLPVHATWPWFSCREIWDMFWPVEEEDWMSFTPGTWTTEELGEGDTFSPRKWPAFLSLCQKIPHPLSFLLVHCPVVLAGFYSQPPSPPGSVSFWIFLPLSFTAHPQISIKDFILRRDTSLRIQIRLPATCSPCSG